MSVDPSAPPHNSGAFFHAGGAEGGSGPRLLLISYHYPPGRATGALRWRKLTRFAHECGWSVDAVTLSPALLERPDDDALKELPPGTRVFGVSTEVLPVERLEHLLWKGWRMLKTGGQSAAAPASGARGSGVVVETSVPRSAVRGRHIRSIEDLRRAYFASIEYAREGQWARRAASVALEVLREGVHRAVISCGPPHMAHEAGRMVAARSGLPFVVDMRDPWSLVQRLPVDIASPVWYQRAERYERGAVEQSSLVVMNTEAARDAMRTLYPDRRERIIAVRNGHDDEIVPRVERGRRFLIAYAGSVYIDRDPRPLFRAAAFVVHELGLAPEDFGLAFVGNVDAYGGVPLREMARQEGLDGFVSTAESMPRAALMEFLAQASMLVSLPQDSDMAIPSKVYEYTLFHAWLLALATEGSAVAMLLRGSGADIVEPGDTPALAGVIRKRYLEHASGTRPSPIAADGRFSRRAQAATLFDAIAQIVPLSNER